MSGVLAKMKTRTPNCSAFPFDFRNKMTNRIGELRPVAVIEMGPNDRCKMSMAQLTRFFPLSAPAMANFQLQVDSVFVPARIVAKKYEKFFNAGTTDEDRPYFPRLKFGEYCSVLVESVGLFTPGLLDYLGYPTFEEVKVFIRNMITTFVANSGNEYPKYTYFDPTREIYLDNGHWQNIGAIYASTGASSADFDTFAFDKDGRYIHFGLNLSNAYLRMKYNSALEHIGLIPYLAVKYTGGSSFTVNAADLAMLDFLSSIGIQYNSYINRTESEILEAFCNAHNRHVSDVLDEYYNFFAKSFELVEQDFHFESSKVTVPSGFVPFLELVFLGNEASDVLKFLTDPDNDFTLLPIFSFWKAYFDWYVNSVLEHGEDLTDAWTNFCNACISYGDYPSSFSEVINLGGYEVFDQDTLVNFWGADPDDNVWPYFCRIPARLWSVDRFTGAYTDTQNGQAVLIPTDGTIRDLKASNQLQRYLEKALFGGTRTIDKNELIYGAHSSNQLLDRTEVLSRKKFNIDIQQVTNSAASDSFDLGMLAGNGFGMGSNFLFDYTCEERGYILIFASVVLPPSYVQALDRNLLHTDYYDFVIPEFDSVGEQEIMPQELYCDKGMSLNPVGYNRRYYEAIDFLSSVHGDLKNSLRHWHDARYFKTTPSLSPEFIRIDPENDDLERIFATYNHDQILHFFAFSGAIVRPMSKYMQFGAL